MLKFEGVAEVGQVIKAFDFQPREGVDDMYVIGRVVDKGPIRNQDGIHVFDGYTILCSFDSLDDRVMEEVFVPFEMSITEFDERVSLV